MTYVATLNENGVLTGYETIPGEPTIHQIPVPEDCDLTPGKYRWDGQTFVPVLPIEGSVDAPLSTIHAIAHGFAALYNQGNDLHPLTVKWLRDYVKSVDNAQPQPVKLDR